VFNALQDPSRIIVGLLAEYVSKAVNTFSEMRTHYRADSGLARERYEELGGIDQPAHPFSRSYYTHYHGKPAWRWGCGYFAADPGGHHELELVFDKHMDVNDSTSAARKEGAQFAAGHNNTHVCSAMTNFLRSAFGFVSPARECSLLLSSLAFRESSMVCLSFEVL
jgi:hypothetical protein